MAYKLKKLLILLLFVSLSHLVCYSQDMSSDTDQQQKQSVTDQEQLQSSDLLNLKFPNLNLKTSDLPLSEIPLFPTSQPQMENLNLSQEISKSTMKTMLNNQLSTVDELRELTLTYANTIESTLKESSESATQWKERSDQLQKHVESITEKLNEVVDENKRIQAALISNNEDEHNTNLLLGEMFVKAEEAETQVKLLERRTRNAVIGFSICGTGVGVGTGIMITGIYNNDIKNTITGASIDVASVGLWLLGHYVFKLF